MNKSAAAERLYTVSFKTYENCLSECSILEVYRGIIFIDTYALVERINDVHYPNTENYRRRETEHYLEYSWDESRFCHVTLRCFVNRSYFIGSINGSFLSFIDNYRSNYVLFSPLEHKYRMSRAKDVSVYKNFNNLINNCYKYFLPTLDCPITSPYCMNTIYHYSNICTVCANHEMYNRVKNLNSNDNCKFEEFSKDVNYFKKNALITECRDSFDVRGNYGQNHYNNDSNYSRSFRSKSVCNESSPNFYSDKSTRFREYDIYYYKREGELESNNIRKRRAFSVSINNKRNNSSMYRSSTTRCTASQPPRFSSQSPRFSTTRSPSPPVSRPKKSPSPNNINQKKRNKNNKKSNNASSNSSNSR